MREHMLDFDLIESENSCTQSIYCSILNWYKLKYELLFLYTWSFWFNEKNNGNAPVGVRMGRKKDRMIDILDSFYSIRFEQIDTSHDFSNDVIDIIHDELLKRNPVILGTNLYWCPWSKKYKKEFRYTDKRLYPGDCDNIIAVGIDLHKEVIYCKEKNTNNNLVFASFNDIINGCKKLSLLKKESNKDTRHSFDYKKNIKRSLEYAKHNDFSENAFRNMRELAACLRSEDLELNHERNGLSDLYFTDIPILDRSMNIGRGRKQFARLLEYIVLNFDASPLSPFIHEFNYINNKWESIKIHFLKGFKLNKLTRQTLDSIADEIDSLSRLEEKIFCDMWNCTK